MTYEQYQAALQVIRLFLEARGFAATRHQPAVQDGNWILAILQQCTDAQCPNCWQPAVEALLIRLEDGSYIDGSPLMAGSENPWTSAHSTFVRTQAGLADSR